MTTSGSAAASVAPAKASKKSVFRRSGAPKRPPLPKAHRRAAFIAGPLSLVITNIGLLTLVLPLAVWYAIVVLKNLFVGLVGLTGGEKAAADVNETSKAISINGLEGFGIVMVVVGAIMVVAGIAISVRVLSKAGVHRAWSVTFSAAGASVVILGILMMIVWAVGGLIFSVNTQTVGELISNAVLAFAAYGLLNVALAAAIGGLVWWWMAHLFRSADAVAEADAAGASVEKGSASLGAVSVGGVSTGSASGEATRSTESGAKGPAVGSVEASAPAGAAATPPPPPANN